MGDNREVNNEYEENGMKIGGKCIKMYINVTKTRRKGRKMRKKVKHECKIVET